jgi:hypothetical protein
VLLPTKAIPGALKRVRGLLNIIGVDKLVLIGNGVRRAKVYRGQWRQCRKRVGSMRQVDSRSASAGSMNVDTVMG